MITSEIEREGERETEREERERKRKRERLTVLTLYNILRPSPEHCLVPHKRCVASKPKLLELRNWGNVPVTM